MLSTDILEAHILGTILLDPSLAKDIIASVPPEIFRSARHRNILKMIAWLDRNGHEPNLVNIPTYFENDLDKVGGMEYLTQMYLNGNVHQIQDTIKNLFEMDSRLRWVKLLEEYREKSVDPTAGKFSELLDEFEQKALDLRPKQMVKQTNSDHLIAWYERLVAKMQNPALAFGIMTGWDPLDRLTLGFQRAHFIVIGARTSIGKTAFANEIKLRCTARGYKVADFSLEMIKDQLFDRLISSLTGIQLQALRVGNVTEGQLEKITLAMDKIRGMEIDDTRGIAAEYITSEMRRLKRQEGLDVVIIDYLQEIEEPAESSDNGGSALKRICQKLRKAAMECDCAVIGLSQVKQEVDVRANKRPFVSDLSGSKSIAEVADDIILLYRDEYYNPDTTEPGIMEVNLAKQRNGPTGTVKMKFDKSTQRISTPGGDYVEQVAGL